MQVFLLLAGRKSERQAGSERSPGQSWNYETKEAERVWRKKKTVETYTESKLTGSPEMSTGQKFRPSGSR